MAEEKKYFWLRLKRDFFKRHDIQIIESMPNGKDYILFYLKLLCESVDHEGNLRFSDEIPYNEQMLATITNTNIDIVRTAIIAFSELGMMDIMDDGTYYMNGVEKLIGSETYWAEQKRKQRAKKTIIMNENRTLSTSCPTRPSKSKSKSNSKSINTLVEKEPTDNQKIIHQAVIDYLNQKTGKHYRVDSKASVRHINGRLRDGYTLDDFVKVIDNKTEQWLDDKRMSSYLRPETLFCAEHFESYLNEVCAKPKDNGYSDLSKRLAEETDRTIATLSEEDYERFN